MWGRYLEVAQNEWNGKIRGQVNGQHDPRIEWCAGRFRDQTLAFSTWTPAELALLGVEIGRGLANTRMLLAYCPKNLDEDRVFQFLYQYYFYPPSNKNVLKKDDWHIPSKDELNELCKYVNYQSTGNSQVGCKRNVGLREGFNDWLYWSSSQYDETQAWSQFFADGTKMPQRKDNTLHIRPIRAF